MQPTITIYGTQWCPDCWRAKRFLTHHAIPFTWIDIDNDRDGEQLVLRINQGMRSVPTILFGDGSHLVEPSTQDLSIKLGFSNS